MSNSKLSGRDPVTLKHYTLFGQLVVEYASLEVGLKLLLAGFMGQGVHRALIYSAPYTSVQIRNVAKAITKLDVPRDNSVYRSVIDAIGAHKGASVLRNDIAHNMWARGDRPRSIAPVYMEIRNERGEMKGMDEEDREYTLVEIKKAVDSLKAANQSLAEFQSKPAFRALVERNISPSKRVRVESDGIS